MFSLRTKLVLVYGGLLVLLVGAVAWAVESNQRHQAVLQRLLAEEFESVRWCRAAQRGLVGLDLYANALESEHPVATPVEPVYRQIEEALGAQVRLVRGQGGGGVLDSEGVLAAYVAVRGKYARFVTMPAGRERTEFYEAAIEPVLLGLGQRLDGIIDRDIGVISSAARSTGAVASTSAGLTEGILIIALLAAAGCLVLVERSVVRPLATLTRSAKAIQAGNLVSPVGISGRDEIGQLGQAFNAMAATLQRFRQSDHEKLLRTQETTRAAINALPDAVAVLSPEGRIELANEPAERLFQITAGRDVRELPLPWLITLVSEAAQRRERVQPEGFRGALQVFDKGRELFFLPHGIPLLDGEGKLLGVTVVLVDATALRQIDEAKSGLLSTVSHELKTPLTSIQMSIHLLLEDAAPRLTAKQLELLAAARDDADRLHQLIAGLLDRGGGAA